MFFVEYLFFIWNIHFHKSLSTVYTQHSEMSSRLHVSTDYCICYRW